MPFHPKLTVRSDTSSSGEQGQHVRGGAESSLLRAAAYWCWTSPTGRQLGVHGQALSTEVHALFCQAPALPHRWCQHHKGIVQVSANLLTCAALPLILLYFGYVCVCALWTRFCFLEILIIIIINVIYIFYVPDGGIQRNLTKHPKKPYLTGMHLWLLIIVLLVLASIIN